MVGNPTVTVAVFVEAGSKYETKDTSGISHFLEHVCFKGTLSRPNASDLSTELDGLGCDSNAFTGEEYTGYYAKVKASNFEKLLEIIADLYLNPIFKSEEIEKEKGVIIDEINMYDDTPTEKVDEVWMRLLYGDQPAGWPITGEREVVRNITREDIVRYRAAHYVAEATTVVISGNVDVAMALEMVAEKFKGISTGTKSSKEKILIAQEGPQVATLYKKTNQTHFLLGVHSFDVHDDRDTTATVLAGILGSGMSSRLFRRIREDVGVGYYVRAINESLTDHGYFVLSAGIANERFEEVVKVMLSELRDLKENLVGEAELSKVKEHLVGTSYLNLERSDDLAFHYGMPEIHRCEIRTPEEEEGRIRAVTAEGLRDLARTLFVEQNLNLAYIGPSKNTLRLRSLLKL
jgi:predicted Zn-dependent peptidase